MSRAPRTRRETARRSRDRSQNRSTRRSSRRTSPRGVTLVELLVGIGVLGIVLASITGAVLSQRKVAVSVELGREMLDNGREALLEIEKGLRMAAFGVDPRVAFDFAHFRCDGDDLITGVNGRQICRDRRDGPDRLSFLARDPHYRIDPLGTNGCAVDQGCPTGQAWHLTARDTTSPPSITVDAREGQRFLAGRVLLVTCSTVARFSMVTVATTTEAEEAGPLRIPLYEAHATDPTRENALDAACFAATPTVFAVDRWHYEIRDYDGMPWLVLDPGLDLDGDGQDPLAEVDLDDLLPIAPGIEDLQFAYVLADPLGETSPDSNQNGVVGDDSAAAAEEPDPSLNAPEYRTAANHETRRNLHPANVRAVRVSLVARSLRPDRGRLGDRIPAAENAQRNAEEEVTDELRRALLTTTVATRNMGSRGMFTF